MAKKQSMDIQEIFTKGVLGIVEQGGPSQHPISYVCYYRGPKGRKCAIGHSIPERKYSSNLEGRGVSSRDVQKALGYGKRAPKRSHLAFLARFQQAHDKAPGHGEEYLTNFLRKAKEIAEEFGLTMPEIPSK